MWDRFAQCSQNQHWAKVKQLLVSLLPVDQTSVILQKAMKHYRLTQIPIHHNIFLISEYLFYFILEHFHVVLLKRFNYSVPLYSTLNGANCNMIKLAFTHTNP